MSLAFSAAFEECCLPQMNMLRCYLFHKIANPADAEDILQEVLLAAYRGFGQLKDKSRFKSWLIGIASHKCADYYRSKALRLEIPLDEISLAAPDSHGAETAMLVNDTLNLLHDREKQILYLFYLKGYSQKDIAVKLGIPLGTVKSRIHGAKESFKALYPHPPTAKRGESNMFATNKGFPAFLPELRIQKMAQASFSVRLEEIPGWLIVPRVGEKRSFAFYDDPDKRLTGVNRMDCVREAVIHGIPCVQVEVEEDDDGEVSAHTKFMRLTETHASYVAELRVRDGVFCFGSFYDDEWLSRYEVGENNLGREIHQQVKGIARVNADGCITVQKEECPDIIGRYRVEIGSRAFDTVALLEVCEGMMTLLYVDESGRTVLFRRFNRFNWKTERYKALWTEKLPNSELLLVNGDKYVHWYDCISDYVMEGTEK